MSEDRAGYGTQLGDVRLIAIDPGAAGGIAWLDSDGIAYAEPMPDGMTAQIDLIRQLGIMGGYGGAKVFIERVGGYMPGNSGPAACKFARHCGHIEAACYAFGLPVTQVTPHKWQGTLGAMPKDKPERKRAIKEAMARRYPALTVTLKTADALGLLCWAVRNTNDERAG